MLTLDQLQRLLKLNELLTVRALRARASTTRLHELSVHRTVIKDCIIELLTNSSQRAA